jgi:hypothetical protein
VIFRLGGVLARLVRGLLPPGDAALRGLELDLSRVADLEQGWRRLCETAWTLGFVELRMAPEPLAADLLAERQAFAPRPWPLLDRSGDLPNAQSTWAFGLSSGGRPVVTVTARRRLGRVDFEPLRFAAAAQVLVDRFVVVPDGAAAALPSATASAHPAALPLSAAE